MQKEAVSIIGLGKLGCSMMACMAKRGRKVIGLDVIQKNVDLVNQGKSPVFEPQVDELLTEFSQNVSATTNYEECIQNTCASFIIVPTPSVEDGSFTTKYVESVIKELGKELAKKKSYHLIVITSTVLPGDSYRLISMLEEVSGKKCNEDFGVCYNPDFIALGTVVRDFLNPDAVFIGESDEKAGEWLESFHHEITENDPKVHRMSIYNAELAKISVNAYCTMKISFANNIAEICENMPTGNAEAVLKALGDDSRIGRKYILSGMPYGGPCFPRDNRALARTAERFSTETPLAIATDAINNHQRDSRIPNLLLKLCNELDVKKVSILGLTYKPDTTLVEESASIFVAKCLLDRGIEVHAYDPHGDGVELRELEGYKGFRLYREGPLECLKDQSVALIATPWKEVKSLSESDFLGSMKSANIIDAWNAFSDFGPKVKRWVLGEEFKSVHEMGPVSKVIIENRPSL